ncbi:MAG: hypothetical protein FJ290_25340, partial [Planctomycetes bacterium]|nr:hypothetical protein [Planctomycetota bacterium]
MTNERANSSVFPAVLGLVLIPVGFFVPTGLSFLAAVAKFWAGDSPRLLAQARVAVGILGLVASLGVMGSLAFVIYRAERNLATSISVFALFGGLMALMSLVCMARFVEPGGEPFGWISVLVGFGVTQTGLWLNADFFRKLETSPLRSWIEVSGAVALVVGVLLFGSCFALLTQLPEATAPLALGCFVGLLLIYLSIAAGHITMMEMWLSPTLPLVTIAVYAALLGAVALGLFSHISLRHYRRADLTRTAFYSLSDQTIKILQSVQKPLRIIGTMAHNPNPQTDEQEFENFVRSRVGELLDEYQNQSRQVEYIPLNIYADPEAADKLGKELKVDFRADNVVLAYGSGRDVKTKVIEFSEILT